METISSNSVTPDLLHLSEFVMLNILEGEEISYLFVGVWRQFDCWVDHPSGDPVLQRETSIYRHIFDYDFNR